MFTGKEGKSIRCETSSSLTWECLSQISFIVVGAEASTQNKYLHLALSKARKISVLLAALPDTVFLHSMKRTDLLHHL